LLCPTTIRIRAIYWRSFSVLSPCLRSLPGAHSKPEKKILESVGSFSSSRFPKPHC
jgi:hypothetical protein